MARKIALDNNERAMLLAYRDVDPEAEQWAAPWASGMDPAKHGADLVGAGLHGRIAICRRLAQRKLLEGEPGARGRDRGYCLTPKGLEALVQIDAEA